MTTENPAPLDPVQPRTIIGRMPKYAAGKPPREVTGLSAFKLSSNENPLPPIPEVMDAIRAQLEINRYPDPLSTKLRNALSEFLSVPADDIVTGAGSLGALTQILATFAGQDDDGVQDEVVFAWRSFEAYPIVVETAGALPVQVPLLADGRHDLDAMAAAVNENTSVILLCTPNNPTGPALRTEEVEAFIAKVPSNVLIVIDEAYQEFVRDPQAVNGIDTYRKHSNVMVLRTFSKAHSLANLRVGYSVSHPEITNHIRVVATPFAVSSVAEDAAVASLAHFDKVVERVQKVVDERTRVVAGLRELGWQIPDADGNFVWLQLGANTAEFAELASEHALAVRAFGNEGVRVSIGEVEANTRFLELCRNYPKAPTLS
ncbi:histidinol-phosphate transaminase [Paeniglutamicibacter psychrophenolicus]|uniref:Histidinol-phosphate aminotransferase n=1 Tax=Paeniglutamicibacter psychrophenolicus TaxID=257454 RepID=A0ABS4WAM4_9MICC|nr:histidinol-phosphate transaminase [Paeniglutamicibacter psychrophenolicus]MBP2373259.1 histidinol-phosphate aminotransferase [Paeniglutamicibacter psychrophenolicus]